jgi:hypothetical protein
MALTEEFHTLIIPKVTINYNKYNISFGFQSSGHTKNLNVMLKQFGLGVEDASTLN